MREFIRKIYYAVRNGRVVRLTKPAILNNYKWIVDTRAGRSYEKGYYEPPVTALIERFLTDNSVFFDVGAHVGYFSILAAAISPNGAVHSFEPDTHNYDYCQLLKRLNKIDRWTINNKGVGERSEVLRYQAGHTTTTGVITTDGGASIEIVSLDDYVTDQSVGEINLIKIDVEGYGGYVLRGAINLIRVRKPTLIMEMHAGSDEYAVFQELITPIYTIFRLDGSQVSNVLTEKPDFVYAIPK